MNQELSALDPHEMLQVFLTREFPRYIGVRGGERHDWLRAEDEVTGDLRVLASGEANAAPPAVAEDAAQAPKAEVLEALLDAIETRVGALGDEEAKRLGQQTECVPLRSNGRPDWHGLRELARVWARSLEYEDGDGDEWHVPRTAEELVDLWTLGRAARERVRRSTHPPAASELDASAAEPYTIRKTFSVGDVITHKKFGLGLVLEAHEKIKVRFGDQERVLVHGRGEPA